MDYLVDLSGIAQTEVQAEVALGEVAAAAANFVRLHESAGRDLTRALSARRLHWRPASSKPIQ